jgi:hypothetical protein
MLMNVVQAQARRKKFAPRQQLIDSGKVFHQ